MVESQKTLGLKKFFFLILIFIITTDFAILLNILFLRQILGFLFLTILPGLLILQILRLNEIGATEKFILSVGLSVSFVIFFGLLINILLFNLRYEIPLATIPLLISFNLAFIVLAVIGCKTNKTPILSLRNLNLSASEKAFLIFPILFPALSILGMHVMNTRDNNIILLFLLFLIPVYIAFICFYNYNFPKRLYPASIFLISISLLLLMSLRSNHIIGVDIHHEYYFFQTTLNKLHWSIFEYSSLNACLSISLLPTVVQSLLNIAPEFLFKIFFPLLFSISPLIIYVLSKKYIGEGYAFIASSFFMFQKHFFWAEFYPRTLTAVLFFALAMMTHFSDKINPLKRRILFIVFMASCIVSHYSTTYIFFLIMLGAFIGVELLSRKYTVKKVMSLTIIILFFSMIFFWYSLVTEAPFNSGVKLIENTLSNLNNFFMEEMRSNGINSMLGEGIQQKGIPHKIEFIFTWLIFAFIGIGFITLLRRYQEMAFPEIDFKREDFLREKFEDDYFMIALSCIVLLFVIVALPFVSNGYDMFRLYAFTTIILSIFFVIGGITVSKYLNKLIEFFQGKKALKKNALKVPGSLIILLVLIPYFFCVTGVIYQIFGIPQSIILNSDGADYDMYYVHDQDSCGAKWLGDHTEKRQKIYTDFIGGDVLMSQGAISFDSMDRKFLIDNKNDDEYIYLRYNNIIMNNISVIKNMSGFERYNTSDYADFFIKNSVIYNNGGSKIWK